MQRLNRARRRAEVAVRIFGIDAAFNSMTTECDVLLCKRQRFALSDSQLGLYQVNAGHPFGNRVFHLNSGVHLHEVEIPFMVNQKFNRASVAVAAGFRSGNRCFLHGIPQFWSHERTRAFFQHLLISPLHTAIPFAEGNGVAVFICNNLHFYMMRANNQLFEINCIISEELLCLFLCNVQLFFQLFFTVYPPDTTTAAAGRCLDEYRIPDFLCNFLCLFDGVQCTL